ncbi:TetR/AcrR family transcriptional regulator [Ketobacter sp. MCCC 1A13808]|uniref:TetR/AcrR family transcriptional regulator n=1 Tax=Ketobacter sp. MCCC 1A13808 TaxID=2602738 RepID=UPI000F18A0EB|nr:TetR/AcrR family transcriptional regulator [Ketobacter sp. MCCC 1A13808]MVF11060.1 TetR/AcrR family transcriptional regulator [Ketobacter sp. MCCC 1A13808]RLP56442.1 MAG: TetR/AcrR family transcriptional regulator [Ketobacter sp.]
MARRNDHSKEEVQSMAIEATRTLISREGIDGVSARKVAQEIGYTVGTLYQNFDNIHDLILHANAFSLSELLAELENASILTRNKLNLVTAIADAYLEYAQTHERQWSAIFKHALPQDQLMPDWYQTRIDALFSVIEVALHTLAPQRDRKSIQIAARTLWSGVHGICILHVGDKLYSHSIATPSLLIKSLVTHFLNSWLKENK